MRITGQLLRSRTLRPLHSVEYLDLSNLGLIFLERLELCPRVQTVILRGNKIETVPDLSCCPELWKIDLANNAVRSLEGLCRVAAFGTLILSNNDLDWNELQKIRHVYILDLCLHGNQKLEVDAYYRMHVIDSLPLVWMLDGRIITSAERVQVQQFFRDSALSDRPVRHKLPKNQFVPSLLKNILVTGVFGKKSEHLMRRFPCKETLNVDLDKRRLMYLAYSLQQEVNLFMKNTLKEKVKPSQLIENLIRYRNEDKEKCNMLLLMLVASLEFAVPSVLVQQTLDVARLGKIGNVDTMDLFILPREIRCRVVSLLLGGVKIERDQHVDGGLYNRLYLCLFDLVADLMRVANGDSIIKYQESRKRLDTRKSGYRCLLASEVIQLLCIVPAFFELLGKDPGILDLTSVATKDPRIGEKIKALSLKIQSEGGGISKVYREIAEFLLETVTMSNRPVISGTKTQEGQRNLESWSQSDVIEPSYIIISKRLIKSQERPQSCAGSMESRLQSCPRRSLRAATAMGVRTSQTVTRGVQIKSTQRRPALGERVEVGHQTFGRLAAIPESNIGLVQLETLAAPKFQQADYVLLSQLDQQFTYVNFLDIKWDAASETWKKVGHAGEVKKRKTAHSSRRSSLRCRSAGVEGRGSEEGMQFLSDAIRQNLKLRVQLPASYDDAVLPTGDAFQTGGTVITDHVRSIVHECLQEADVKWTNGQPPDEDDSVVTDHKDIELTVHDESNIMNNVLPVSEVSVTMDSESTRDDLIVGERREDKSLNAETVEDKGLIEDTSDEEDVITELHGLEEEMVSYTEHARINAWKTPEVIQKASNSGIPSRVGSATRLSTSPPATPPPQRPSSPRQPVSIPLTQAYTWLAGGRDINSARVKRLSVPLPGWMDGWEECDGRRPKSSPASRGSRQSAGPVISKPQFTRPTSSTGFPMGGAAQVFVRGRAPPSFSRLPSARIMVRRR